MPGKLLVVEGVDFVGKSTIVTLLSEWLATKHGINNIITRHPGATPVGAQLRKFIKESKADEISIPPRTEGLIMAADNSAFIDLVLKPTLDKGQWVVGDRNNYISGLVYQMLSGTSFDDLDKIQAATAPADQPKIDILFILRADADTRARRRKLRNEGKPDRFEDRGQKYMDDVAAAYDTLAEKQRDRLLKFVASTEMAPGEPSPLVFYVDAAKPIGNVMDTITYVIESRLALSQQSYD